MVSRAPCLCSCHTVPDPPDLQCSQPVHGAPQVLSPGFKYRWSQLLQRRQENPTHAVPTVSGPLSLHGKSYLADNKQVLPSHHALLDLGLDSHSDLILVVVHGCTVHVAVAHIYRHFYSLCYLPWNCLQDKESATWTQDPPPPTTPVHSRTQSQQAIKSEFTELVLVFIHPKMRNVSVRKNLQIIHFPLLIWGKCFRYVWCLQMTELEAVLLE